MTFDAMVASAVPESAQRNGSIVPTTRPVTVCGRFGWMGPNNGQARIPTNDSVASNNVRFGVLGSCAARLSVTKEMARSPTSVPIGTGIMKAIQANFIDEQTAPTE